MSIINLPCPHNDGKECRYCHNVTAQDGWRFKGCFCPPLKGMFIAEVKECPREMTVKGKMKEVDLDKECRKYLTEHFNVYEDDILQSKRSGMPLDTFDVMQVAKHFYELGLMHRKEE